MLVTCTFFFLLSSKCIHGLMHFGVENRNGVNLGDNKHCLQRSLFMRGMMSQDKFIQINRGTLCANQRIYM